MTRCHLRFQALSKIIWMSEEKKHIQAYFVNFMYFLGRHCFCRKGARDILVAAVFSKVPQRSLGSSNL
ncbi:unnamed protein product [Calypogeia fissa]